MFSHEGSDRSDRENRLLAGYLAFIAGYTNSSGFLLVGTFTSHVTGNVGRLANDLAKGNSPAAVSAVTLLLAFFSGAFAVSVVLESRAFRHVSRAYAFAMGLEALLLAGFTLFSNLATAAHPRVLDAGAALLCAAMGMQNGLVTRISGAVVRTTHLTGVVTDLGIESARWFRYWRRSLASVVSERPSVTKSRLLVTIAVTFLLGAVAGALVTVRLGAPSMLLAAVAIAGLGFYALRHGRVHDAGAARLSRR